MATYDDVTWTSCILKSPVIQLFVSQLMLTHTKEALKSALLAFCAWNSLVTSEFPAQRTSNTEKASIWWRHHVTMLNTKFHNTKVRFLSMVEQHLGHWEKTLHRQHLLIGWDHPQSQIENGSLDKWGSDVYRNLHSCCWLMEISDVQQHSGV